MNGISINGSSAKMSAPIFELKSTTLPLTTAFSSISPSSFTAKDKTNDTSQNSEYKFTKSIFKFGDHKSDDDKKSEAAFTFNLVKPNADFISKNLNMETLKTKDIENKKDLGQFDESKTDTHSEENADNSNKKTNEDVNQQKQQNEEINSDKEFNMKMLFNEFKELIKNFLKERVESEKKIILLEKRVEVLENERQLLQEVMKERQLFNIADNISTASTKNRAETALISQSIVPSDDSTANLGNFQSRASEISLPVNYECAAASFPNAYLQSSVNASFNRNDYHNNLSSSFGSSPMQTGMYHYQASPTMNSLNVQEAGLLAQCRIKSHSELGTLHKGKVLYEPFMKHNCGNVEDKTIKMPNDLDSNQRKENIDNERFNDLQSLIEQSIQNALKGTLTQFRQTVTDTFTK